MFGLLAEIWPPSYLSQEHQMSFVRHLVWFDESSLPITLLPFVVVHKLTHSRLREHEHSWEWLRPQLIASIHNSDSNLCLESRRQCLISLSLKKDRGVSLDNVTPQLRADRAECLQAGGVWSHRNPAEERAYIKSPTFPPSGCCRPAPDTCVAAALSNQHPAGKQSQSGSSQWRSLVQNNICACSHRPSQTLKLLLLSSV